MWYRTCRPSFMHGRPACVSRQSSSVPLRELQGLGKLMLGEEGLRDLRRLVHTR
jgi:hypothetical protein